LDSALLRLHLKSIRRSGSDHRGCTRRTGTSCAKRELAQLSLVTSKLSLADAKQNARCQQRYNPTGCQSHGSDADPIVAGCIRGWVVCGWVVREESLVEADRQEHSADKKGHTRDAHPDFRISNPPLHLHNLNASLI
jgi:hypothetical protein